MKPASSYPICESEGMNGLFRVQHEGCMLVTRPAQQRGRRSTKIEGDVRGHATSATASAKIMKWKGTAIIESSDLRLERNKMV